VISTHVTWKDPKTGTSLNGTLACDTIGEIAPGSIRPLEVVWTETTNPAGILSLLAATFQAGEGSRSWTVRLKDTLHRGFKWTLTARINNAAFKHRGVRYHAQIPAGKNLVLIMHGEVTHIPVETPPPVNVEGTVEGGASFGVFPGDMC